MLQDCPPRAGDRILRLSRRVPSRYQEDKTTPKGGLNVEAPPSALFPVVRPHMASRMDQQAQEPNEDLFDEKRERGFLLSMNRLNLAK